MAGLARVVLDALQPRSIAEGREYCGYIYRRDAATLAATPPRRGGATSCDLRGREARTLASYHTHGAAAPDYDNEVPSSTDLATDIAFGTDGYIATPAGRLWHVDHRARRAWLLCTGCLVADPAATPGTVAPVYTLAQLLAREGR